MLNLLSLFSGIGSPEKALTNLGIPFHLVNYCEIDKYASKSYATIHNASEDLNLWDVTKITKDSIKERVDLIFHGSPCTDYSLAGKQKGGDEGSGTRSSLMYETLRIVADYNPKFVIWENIKNVLSKRHIHNFENYKNRLNDLGYNSYWKVLNAKDYGIPQNRERIFCISIRKDIDRGGYKFPEPIPLRLKLKDLLDTNVDAKYNLSDVMLRNITFAIKESSSGIIEVANLNSSFHQSSPVISTEGICSTLLARDYKQPKAIIDDEGCKVSEVTKKGYSLACPGDSINLEQPNSKTRSGRVEYGVAQTLTTSCNQAVVENE